jgi:hypothetical protein
MGIALLLLLILKTGHSLHLGLVVCEVIPPGMDEWITNLTSVVNDLSMHLAQAFLIFITVFVVLF